MKNDQSTAKIVIVGGGFAGIECAKKLLKLNKNIHITMVSNKPYFEYFPALYKLVTGAWSLEASIELRKIFKKGNIDIIEGIFQGINTSSKEINISRKGKEEIKINYDYLVLAMGSETNFFNIKGLPELSYSFKSVNAALALKKHFCDLFAETEKISKDELIPKFHVVVVGAGPSGVELAGDLRSYLTRVANDFSIDPSLVTIDLIEASNRVLPTLPLKASKIAESRLRKMGVNIFLNRALQSQDVEEVILKDMEMSARTVIWTAGTKINSSYLIIPELELDKKNKVVVSPYLSLPHYPNIFVAGDGASVQYSGVAQSAIEQGKYIAIHLNNIFKNKKVIEFTPRRPAYVVPIGVNWAILSFGDFVVSGYIVWVLRSLIDFRYFLQMLSFNEAVDIFKKGKKYREINGGCLVDPLPAE